MMEFWMTIARDRPVGPDSGGTGFLLIHKSTERNDKTSSAHKNSSEPLLIWHPGDPVHPGAHWQAEPMDVPPFRHSAN